MDIRKMKLHEHVWISRTDLDVIRVVGGWIYRNYDNDKDYYGSNMVFVPELRKNAKEPA